MDERKGKPRWRVGMLGAVALIYVSLDYLRKLSPSWHSFLQPILWGVLSVAAACKAPFYPYWSLELRSALPFLGSLIFMLSALVIEAISVQFVTSVLGLDWHWTTSPLPDTGQWFLLALNERLPSSLVQVLRAPLIGLHHYLMLFLMLAFSVLFDCVKAPGLGLGARYMFTMAVGRLLRVLTFVATILPSARPWCASARFDIPAHPHPWAQKYFTPYADDPNKVRQLLQYDIAFGSVGQFPSEVRPDWGYMSFLIDFLRPSSLSSSEAKSWFNTLKRAGGGCNDLVYSGHMLVAVLTAMAWTEAYPGRTSATIWLLVMHSCQREIRERHHYSVDCVAAIYVGIMLWRTTGFIWSTINKSKELKLKRLAKIERRLTKAAKDADINKVQELLREVDSPADEDKPTKWAIWIFATFVIFFSIGLALLAFVWTIDG